MPGRLSLAHTPRVEEGTRPAIVAALCLLPLATRLGLKQDGQAVQVAAQAPNRLKGLVRALWIVAMAQRGGALCHHGRGRGPGATQGYSNIPLGFGLHAPQQAGQGSTWRGLGAEVVWAQRLL